MELPCTLLSMGEGEEVGASPPVIKEKMSVKELRHPHGLFTKLIYNPFSIFHSLPALLLPRSLLSVLTFYLIQSSLLLTL